MDEHTRLFADQLRTASGLDVRFLVDERRERRASNDPQIISLNPSNYRALGLFTPQDAAWRCGDYGIYMAWQAHPDREFFWLIEDDVRISGNVEEFFARCSLSAADLLAVNLIEAERDHFWWPHPLPKTRSPIVVSSELSPFG